MAKKLLSHLKETPKQYIEIHYRMFICALFKEMAKKLLSNLKETLKQYIKVY